MLSPNPHASQFPYKPFEELIHGSLVGCHQYTLFPSHKTDVLNQHWG